MQIVVRADASHSLGTGHIMRCLTLVEALEADTLFVCTDTPGHLGAMIRARGHVLELLPAGLSLHDDAMATAQVAQNADRVIVDHYGLDSVWEKYMPCPVMAIDDLADRPHVCDILLDQNLGRKAGDYAGLVEPETRCLLGPEYALLRPEFAKARPAALARRSARASQPAQKLLVSMGGTDDLNATGWVLDVLSGMDLPEGFSVDVLLGSTAPHKAIVEKACTDLHVSARLIVGANNVAELMANSDLAIGAAGSTSWERCTLGLPAIMVVLADNQLSVAGVLYKLQVACLVSNGDDLGLIAQIELFTRNSKVRFEMSERAAIVCDGQGVSRVEQILSGYRL